MTRTMLVLLLALLIVAGCDRGPSADKVAAGAALDAFVKIRTLMGVWAYEESPADAAYADLQSAMSRAEREASKSPSLPWLQKCLTAVIGMRADKASIKIDHMAGESDAESRSRFDGHLAELDQHIEAAKAALK